VSKGIRKSKQAYEGKLFFSYPSYNLDGEKDKGFVDDFK
jgi:hypothetical protein